MSFAIRIKENNEPDTPWRFFREFNKRKEYEESLELCVNRKRWGQTYANKTDPYKFQHHWLHRYLVEQQAGPCILQGAHVVLRAETSTMCQQETFEFVTLPFGESRHCNDVQGITQSAV